MSIPPPPGEAELLDFPPRTIGPADDAPLYRITRGHDSKGNARDVLHFGSSGLGRIDLRVIGIDSSLGRLEVRRVGPPQVVEGGLRGLQGGFVGVYGALSCLHVRGARPGEVIHRGLR